MTFVISHRDIENQELHQEQCDEQKIHFLSPIHLNHMLLNASWIMASKNGQKLVIRYKEKPGESITFRVKIIIQAFLTFFQTIDQVLHRFQSSSRVTRVENFWVLCSVCHDLREVNKLTKYKSLERINNINYDELLNLFERLINSIKLFGFFR